ncbi:MAG: tRNA preQ1(34) S-adenosylmethionine ribosyltransferase-isomerase QueA [Clostridia bacterium]|nr:tRNA preQ1(34) S-adenosylmethionine ribosyltransferase-isomerase QueA [Clostridia bacterium]
MNKSDFYYDLPQELIAQTHIYPRDNSRMLVYDRQTDNIEHRHFYDILDYLKEGDVLVINNTKVIPARIFCHREGKDEIIEVLLLKRIDYNHYECITKPAKKLKLGTKVIFSEKLSAEVKEIGEQGIRVLEFFFDGVLENILNEIGTMPLPPYIKEKLLDQSRYQTVYCKELGSSAAPTAGLHFTEELLKKIQAKGVQIAKVLLHVGLGTFRPVKEEDILKHNMHSEYCEIDKENAEIINNAVKEGRRVICVGTTSVRTVESLADENGFVKADKMDTNIFIYPSYKFKVVKGLITNFHLPESTLIMLVSAFMGRENTLNMYKVAVEEKYRFFSFGDATLII